MDEDERGYFITNVVDSIRIRFAFENKDLYKTYKVNKDGVLNIELKNDREVVITRRKPLEDLLIKLY